MNGTNELIINNLTVLLDQAKQSLETKDKFRAKAYANAIKAVKASNVEIKSGKEAQQLAGVGKKIAEKIQEIIDTGNLHQVQELDKNVLQKTSILQKLSSVWGVGPVKAKQLYENGARGISDLGRPELFKLLNDNQKIGLKYYTDLQKRMPRESLEQTIEEIADCLKETCREKGWRIKYKVCGSYRRNAETCGDMDLLLTAQKGSLKTILATVVEKMTKRGILIERLGLGETKYMGITRVLGTAFRIDIEIINPSEWAFALLYFTGSGSFNEKQRLIAKKKGYSLSEHGLKNVETDKYIQGTFETEKDIFKFLGMNYVVPSKR